MSSTEQITRYRWTINKMTQKTLDESPDTQMFSNEFILIKSRVKFVLKFVPNYSDSKENEVAKRYCSLYLCAVDLDERKSLDVNYSMWIEDNDGKVLVEKPEIKFTFNETDKIAGFPKIVSHQKLCSSAKNSVPGHRIYACIEVRSNDLFNELSKVDVFDDFKQKMWEFYKSGLDDHCTLKHGANEFKVSKTLLTAHSRFFEQMFLLEDEGKKNEFEFTDASLEVIQALVKYVYLMNLDEFVDIIDQLYVVAVNYKFSQLQIECAEIMGSLINENNAAFCLTTAFIHCDSKLKNYALEFVKREPQHRFLKPVLKSKEWKDLIVRDEALSDSILDSIFDKSFIKAGSCDTLESVVRFRWTISDFLKNAPIDDPTMTLLSENFSLNRSHVRFHLKFEPTSRANFGSPEYSSLYICVDGLETTEKLNIGYCLWIENSTGKTVHGEKDENVILTDIVNSIGHPKFVLQDRLYSEHFCKDNTIHICCDIFVNEPLTEIIPEKSLSEQTRKRMFSIYESGVNDSCILQVDGRPFKLPKTLLIANSKFFEHHFSPKGPMTNVIDVQSVNCDAMESLVKYLYLENDNDLKANVDDIFKLSHRFALHEVQSKCSRIMCYTLDISNVARRLIIGHKCNDPKLKNCTLAFVTKKPQSKFLLPVLECEEWKEFALKYKDLSNDILKQILH